ncbi:hypothetical protein Tco_1536291, partial [Tanacetum coccineum]
SRLPTASDDTFKVAAADDVVRDLSDITIEGDNHGW